MGSSYVQLDKPIGEAYGEDWYVLVKGIGPWICTVEYPCGNPAVYGNNNSSGMCVEHAQAAGVLPVVHGGYVYSSQLHLTPKIQWGPAQLGWACTFKTSLGKMCNAPAVYAPVHGSVLPACGLCADHAGYFIPHGIVTVKDTVMEIAGLPYGKSAWSVEWKSVEGALSWVCTFSGCGKPAVYSAYTAGLCKEHAALVGISVSESYKKPALSTLGALDAYTPPKPPVSVLTAAATYGKSVVLPKGIRKGAPVDPLGIPWEADYNKLHGVYTEHSKPVGDIGLHEHLSLPQAACEFYLLMDASLCSPSTQQEEAARQFSALTDYLAAQMSLYIECACLGEARYAMGRVRDTSNVKFLKNPKWAAVYNDICNGDKDRYTVWKMFPVLSRKYSGGKGRSKGTDLLLFSVLVHDTLNWRSGGFGGKKWAECAKTVLAYRRRRIDAVSFVDTAFGLKHNGNIVFDKLWNVAGIEHILDANQRGDMTELCKLASTEVTDLWKAVTTVG